MPDDLAPRTPRPPRNVSLNTWLALLLVVGLLAAPFLLLLAPLWGTWLWLQVRALKRSEFKVLIPFQVRTVMLASPVLVRGPEPKAGWIEVARRVDRYIGSMPLWRMWRVLGVFVALELLPLLTLRPPFRWMSHESRIAFVDRHMATTRGLFGITSLGRQAFRLAYYSLPENEAATGFRPMGQRKALRAELAARREGIES